MRTRSGSRLRAARVEPGGGERISAVTTSVVLALHGFVLRSAGLPGELSIAPSFILYLARYILGETMQSWQADLLNLHLSLTVKPLFRHLTSVNKIRQVAGLADRSLGRLSVPRVTSREPVTIPGARFEAEWVDGGNGRDDRVILYLPGGAYVMRTPNTHTAMVSRLCKLSGFRALMVHYRLAPEHPFPACLEDAIQAYKWLLSQGYKAHQIALAGDSAGGGLCLSTLLCLRDEGLPLPNCAYLISPLLDVSEVGASRWKNALSDSALPAPRDRAVNPRPLYLGENRPEDPIVSPINGDLSGLPPLYIQVSDSEMLLDDSLRLARRGHTFGADVQVDVWRKLPHVWPLFPFLPEATKALARAEKFLSRQFSGADAHVPG